MKMSKKLVVNGPVNELLASLPAMALLATLLLPSIAHAETAIQSATSEIMGILVPVFVTLIGALATWILRKVQQKLHIEVGDRTALAWDELARRAALRGGEWARNKSKDLTDGKKLPGGEVMEVAAIWAVEMAKQQKLPEMARNKLEGLIEAHLFELREQQERSTAARLRVV